MRKQWSKSDIKQFIRENPVGEKVMSKKSKVYEDNNVLFIDEIPAFFREGKTIWIPTLHLILKFDNLLPKVFVDKGAIKFVVNGADIMRPGITKSESFSKESFIAIVDENYNKPLAIGEPLFNSEDLMNKESGKVVKNLHYIGDDIWKGK